LVQVSERGPSAKASPRVEEYLETIYMLAEERQPVIGARLAELLGVSRATVTMMLQRMARDGLVVLDSRKQVTLTAKGQALAEASMRRHRLIERFLTDVLGFDWARSDVEAHNLEHCISAEVEAALNRFLGYPSRCPHGNPIPGNPPPADLDLEQPLASLPVGACGRVARVAEPVENTLAVLQYVQERGIRPGVGLKVLDYGPRGDSLVVLVGERPVSLGRDIARFVFVVPETAPERSTVS